MNLECSNLRSGKYPMPSHAWRKSERRPSLAQPIRELTEAIRGGWQPRQSPPERESDQKIVKDRLWRTKDLAVYFGTSAVAASKMAERHGIPHMRIGRTRLYDPSVVKRWLARSSERTQ
jgi:hypothetical protein